MRWLTTARRFIFKESEMVVVDLGYKKVVLDRERAMALIEILETADIYEEVYWTETDRIRLGMGNESYTYHVYANDSNFSMQIMSESKYQMAKLAGKPVRN
jgi:hypothetical protein